MSSSYQRFSGVCSILAGIAGLLYLAAFTALKNPAALQPSLALLAVGILVPAVMVGLYQRLRREDESFALLGLLLGVGGAGGAAIHAAFDLANNFHPPTSPFNFANPVDPRGFLTFAIAGAAALILSGLIVRGGAFPLVVGYIGLISGAFLILLYIAYITTLDPTSPVVLFLIFASGIMQPVWYLAIGWSLLQRETRAAKRVSSAKHR